MPGHKVVPRDVKNTALFDKYQCPYCSLLLKNAVQPLCGHWLCESCAHDLLASVTPKCPRLDCQEDLMADSDEGAEYFPDRFVRREIEGLIVCCTFHQGGCEWEGRLAKLESHLKTCEFVSKACPDCGIILTLDQMESHKLACPKAMMSCPLAGFGCSTTKKMMLEDLKMHAHEHAIEHLQVLGKFFKGIVGQLGPHITAVPQNDSDDERNATGQSFGCFGDDNERDCAGTNKIKSKGSQLSQDPKTMGSWDTKLMAMITDSSLEQRNQSLQSSTKRFISNASPEQSKKISSDGASHVVDNQALLLFALKKENERCITENKQMKEELETQKYRMQKLKNLSHHRTVSSVKLVQQKEKEIGMLRVSLAKIEKAKSEDNCDGTISWKIPEFSQRMSDTQTGKYTSIFSLPFYTGRYGYKMCLRLYILGDGIGKNSHMSLFFVIMKGEFDNVLQWPFTHKVTFKLINQTGGRDIIDTFQPDPMSSSFHKPKSDMNIASGCLRFVSHTELKSGGFIVDDTVFIKCSVDCIIQHP